MCAWTYSITSAQVNKIRREIGSLTVENEKANNEISALSLQNEKANKEISALLCESSTLQDKLSCTVLERERAVGERSASSFGHVTRDVFSVIVHMFSLVSMHVLRLTLL